MTLDEAIKLYTQRAENHEYILHSGEFIGEEGEHMKQDIKRCVSENRQLAEWLKEIVQRRERCAQYEVEQISNLEQYDMLSQEYEILNERYKEAKQLLKVAVEDFSEMKPYLSEPYSHLCDKWRYADEALKLIGDESNGVQSI